MIAAIYARKSTEQTGVSDEGEEINRVLFSEEGKEG